MIIHASEVFTVDEDAASIDVRHIENFELETFIFDALPDSLRAIHVARGMARDDFGLFVTAINNDGAAMESFLMQRYMGDGRGIIVPSDKVLESPGHMLSSELARKISIVHPEEIEQFGLSSLISVVKKQYPGIK
jgi:hypothetical protein